MEVLLKELKKYYRLHRRDLPWRPPSLKLRKGKPHLDPYNILVSEVMLQQTQVERVVPYYKNFVKEFPTAKALAKAPLSKVLAVWSGLGYNRRAKFLHQAARVLSSARPLSKKSSGRPAASTRLFSREAHATLTSEFLESLPGVGHYTARAVVTFALNKPEVFVETNIRTVFLHHCFHSQILKNMRISDGEILLLVEKALRQSKMQPRDFYMALMDYGAHLKRSGVRLNQQSAHYTKQKTFKGSSRQLRGQILKLLLQKPHRIDVMIHHINWPKREVQRELEKLQKEELIVKKGNQFAISD